MDKKAIITAAVVAAVVLFAYNKFPAVKKVLGGA
jgi:hypothetical protein